MFPEYKFSPVQVSDAAVATAAVLAALEPGANPSQFAARNVATRLRAKPETFLQYGPYWWAVKAALRVLGEDFGPADDALIRGEYGGGLPAYAALVAGEQFRDHYNRTFLAGTAQFWLDAEAEQSYVLFDQDMEVRRLGGKSPLLVSADLQPVPAVEGESTVLDGVTAGPQLPFAVEFEHDAELWTANVYAESAVAAGEKVRSLERSNRLLRAIEFSKSVGGAALDSADASMPLYVDRAARKVCEMASIEGLVGASPRAE